MKIAAIKYITGITIILLFYSCSNHSKGFQISGKLDGVDNRGIALFEWNGKKDTIAVAKSENNHFVISGAISSPLMCYIEIQGVNGYIPAFIENTDIEIAGDINDLKNVEITGSNTDKLYKDFSKVFSEKFKSFKDSVSALYNKAEESNDEMLLEKAKAGYGVLYTKQKQFIIEFSKKHLYSYAIPYIMLEELFFRASLDEVKDLYNQLDTNVKKSKYGQIVDDRIVKLDRVAIGKIAPDFIMNDTSGAPLALSSFRGKWVLIDFWSSNCAPCRRDNPKLADIYKKFNSRGFEILGISSDVKKELWTSAIRKDRIIWPQVSSLDRSNDIARKTYCWEYNPYNLLINPEGVIIAKELNFNDLEIKLSEVLNP